MLGRSNCCYYRNSACGLVTEIFKEKLTNLIFDNLSSMSTAPVTTPVPTPNKALLTWEDPARTGKVFGGIVAILIVFKTVNLFNVFFHVAYLGLTGKFLTLLR